MSYLSENILRRYIPTFASEQRARRIVKGTRAAARLSVFLSHSHQDRELVQGFIGFLSTFGIEVYVDWLDSTLPRVTDQATAAAVRNQIRVNDIFVMLATRSALTSRWVPWETGVADQIKGVERIFVVPVTDSSGGFTGNEYLQLYQRIEVADAQQIGVFAPGQNNGFLAEEVLRGYASR